MIGGCPARRHRIERSGLHLSGIARKMRPRAIIVERPNPYNWQSVADMEGGGIMFAGQLRSAIHRRRPGGRLLGQREGQGCSIDLAGSTYREKRPTLAAWRAPPGPGKFAGSPGRSPSVILRPDRAGESRTPRQARWKTALEQPCIACSQAAAQVSVMSATSVVLTCTRPGLFGGLEVLALDRCESCRARVTRHPARRPPGNRRGASR